MVKSPSCFAAVAASSLSASDAIGRSMATGCDTNDQPNRRG
jgi:hypothetical protein